jgi:hypothetical protein
MSTLGSAAVLMMLVACLVEGVAGHAAPTAATGVSTKGTAAPTAPWSISFHDGSGNGLRLWKASKRARVRFEFTPVQPENSSTGMYSGGKASKGHVDARKVRELWRWVRKLEGDRALRAETRDKGTGAFSVKEPSGGERAFLIADGPLLREFTQWLRMEVVGPESYNPTMRKPER